VNVADDITYEELAVMCDQSARAIRDSIPEGVGISLVLFKKGVGMVHAHNTNPAAVSKLLRSLADEFDRAYGSEQ
jgi:hypothetical protein